MDNITESSIRIEQLNYISMFLKNIRFSNGLTQQQAAEQTKLHRNTIHRAENSKNITLDNLLKLCDFYNISLSDLQYEE